MRRADINNALYYQIFETKPRKGERRRVKIIEAFIECLAKKGLDNTSFDTIGKMVGMQRTHVAYYFANREELIRTAIRYVWDVSQDLVVELTHKATSNKGKFKAVIDAPFDWFSRYPHHCSVVMLFYYNCGHDKSYRELQSVFREGGENRVLAALQPFLEEYGIPNRKAKELARAIHSMLTGSLIYYFTSNYPIDLETLKKRTLKDALLLLEAYGE